MRFGVTERIVEQRLRLGNAAPELLDAYRAEEIDLETLKAFAVTTDHERQRSVWEQVSAQGYRPSAWQVKRMLTEERVPAGSAMGRFVGVETYEAAGGAVLRDLFADKHENGVWLEDPALLAELAVKKLTAAADELATRWKWAEVMPDADWSATARYRRIHPEPGEPTDAEKAEIERLRARHDELANMDDDEWTEALVTDDGAGIADASVLLSFGENGWNEDLVRREDAAGMGMLSLARRGCTVSSRPRTMNDEPRPGWRIELAPEHFLGEAAAEVHPDDAAPYPSISRSVRVNVPPAGSPADAHPRHRTARAPLRRSPVRAPPQRRAPHRARRHGGRTRAPHPARGRGRRAGDPRRPRRTHRRLPRHSDRALDPDRPRAGRGALPRALPRHRAQGPHHTTRAEGLRRLDAGDSGLHCGGIDDDAPLPDFLRRERFLDMTAGIVARRDHPLLARDVTENELPRYPWVDLDWPATAGPGEHRAPLPALLQRLHERTHTRVRTILRTGSTGLLLMIGSPYLAWLSLDFLERLPGAVLRPVPLEFGRYAYCSGFVARRSAEDLPPFRRLETIVRETALERRA